MLADFLDSNLFIYLFDERSPKKRDRARALIGDALERRSGAISFQVVQEVLNVLTTRLDPPIPESDARDLLENMLGPLWLIHPDEALYRKALALQHRYRYGFYDSLILAAAIHAGCRRLLSEDLQHGQRIDSLRIENPFADLEAKQVHDKTLYS